MRIVFLCGSLEPGRDGVGDYTQLLAGECARQGHACAIIALNDRHLDKPLEDGAVGSQKSGTPFLRLPATMPQGERTALAGAFCARFRPDWISLQFVPYSFNNKGIIIGFMNQLRVISAHATHVHVMFHELWIGMSTNSPPRQQLVGTMQRWFILSMIRKLRPAVIHTHTPLYRAMLQQAGFEASILPLFGSIPLIGPSEESMAWLWDALANAGSPVTRKNRSDFWLGGFFGALHREWEPEPFFSLLDRTAQEARKKVCLLTIGRLGAGEARWDRLATQYTANFALLKLGERHADEISQFLREIDFGVSTTPWALIQKSATAAAMLEHGVPVIVTRNDFEVDGAPDLDGNSSPLLLRLDSHLASRFLSGLPRQQPLRRLPSITSQFLNALAAGESSSREPL